MHRDAIILFTFLAGIAAAAPANTVPAPAPAAQPPAVQPGRVARTTDLRDKPANDGAMLKVVQANTVVEVAERQGGWYKVTVDGASGWMRISAIRFGTTVASSGGGGGSALSFLQSGRSAVTSGTVTTGVRGLSEETLQKAEPNYTAVAALDSIAVTGDDARGYAGELPTTAVKVDYVAAPDKDKKKGKRGGK